MGYLPYFTVHYFDYEYSDVDNLWFLHLRLSLNFVLHQVGMQFFSHDDLSKCLACCFSLWSIDHGVFLQLRLFHGARVSYNMD